MGCWRHISISIGSSTSHRHTEIYDITQVIRNLTYAFIGHTIKCQKDTTDITIGILVPYETDNKLFCGVILEVHTIFYY